MKINNCLLINKFLKNEEVVAYAMLITMLIITGKVIKGKGYGRKIGFPTINLDRREYNKRNMRAKLGVYAGIATLQKTGKKFKAAIVVAQKDKSGLPKIEAYLLGFTGVLYGEKVELSFKKYLRRFMSFRDINVLKKEIVQDVLYVDRFIKLT